jgi:hypothetical protein
VESYCGSEADAAVVKRKTAEEFYMWLERKVKQAKKIEAESQKMKVRGRKT